MGTCSKCGRKLADNDLIYWKCLKCGKVFNASLAKLKNLWKQKQTQPGQALLKCPGCGYGIDDGNEMLAYKCPGCGAARRGNLEGVVEERKNDLADINFSIQREYTEKNLDINKLTGVEFEKVCQQLVENMGFETEITKASGDGGIDLIAYNRQPLLSGKYIIQCKRYSGSVGEPIIRDLYGVTTSERANKGVLMTTGYFTKSAIAFADGKPIELIDGVAMHSLLKQYGMIEKSFEEQKSDYMEEAAQKLEDILSMLNDDEYDPYDFTQEEKQILKEKEQLFEKNRVKENEKLLATEEVKIFKNSLTIAENRDKYKVSSEILNHYIEHINCIFQIVTDQTSLSECDMNGNIKNTFKGTIFYFINAKENIATIGDIVNRNIPISLDFSCQQGVKFISLSMDVSSDFVISSDTLKKSITISNKKSKINLSLPFGDDYRNAYDYLYILKNTNNVMR